MSMKMRSFGKLGISGSAFGLGCMRFPMVEKDGKKVVDEENAIRIIRTAIDGGVTYLDTAYVYLGQQSERVVGKALQDGYREKVTIATKLPTWLVEKEEDLAALLRRGAGAPADRPHRFLPRARAQRPALAQDQGPGRLSVPRPPQGRGQDPLRLLLLPRQLSGV